MYVTSCDAVGWTSILLDLEGTGLICVLALKGVGQAYFWQYGGRMLECLPVPGRSLLPLSFDYIWKIHLTGSGRIGLHISYHLH